MHEKNVQANDLRNCVMLLEQQRKKNLKNSGLNWTRTLTSAMQVLCSTNRVIRPTVYVKPVDSNMWVLISFELRMETILMIQL